MLSCLRIHQFAIIDELEVELGPGCNVLTGETGAGKSILVNALQLVLGGRGRAEVVRSGAEQAEVEALFDVSDDPVALARLAEQDIRTEGEVVLRRVNQSNGHTRAYVNGRLATASQLKELASGLVDISSQHEHQTLTDPSNHLSWLDRYARLGDLRDRLEASYDQLAASARELETLAEQQRTRTERQAWLGQQLDELERASLRPGEDRDLEEEANRLRHAERLAQGTGEAEEEVWGREDAICTRLGRVVARIQDLARLDPRLADPASRLASARVELEEAARDLGAYARDVVADPARLGEVEGRLHLLQRLKRKHGGSLESIVAWRDQAARDLLELERIEVRVEDAERTWRTALAEVEQEARHLSARRQAESRALGEAITRELHSLGMGGARVVVDVAPLEARAGGFSLDGARLTASGIDRVEFLIAPNPGEEPRPLRRVASGGELSRSLLAIKRALAGLGPVGTYVFDEVDAGVGGAVADVIGRKLHEVSRHHQVICITHLPQIAAYADLHLHVRKTTQEGRTTSSMVRLGPDERCEEIARMLGAANVSAATRLAAAELVRAAERLKGNRE